MSRKKKMTEQEKQSYRTRILIIMAGHVGKSNRIGMGELYEQVFETTYEHRINDTRPLRILITELRKDGVAICSKQSQNSGGYWLASAGSELTSYCETLRKRALGILGMEAKVRKMTLPELVGQLSLELKKE
ncbi:MAG: hypothetical protein SWH54_00350 [Thermodesulfobacteriota bacterium]|nr:hypothetical protein [Thermodesulfobacteriota bacterium]